jgi:hypothetical protein
VADFPASGRCETVRAGYRYGMTDRNEPEDDLSAARRIAAAHTAATRDVEAFLRQAPQLPEAADLAEYTTLLAREEALRGQRQTAAEAAGYAAPSLGGQ